MQLESTIFVDSNPYESINSNVVRSPAKLLRSWLIVKWNPDGTQILVGSNPKGPTTNTYTSNLSGGGRLLSFGRIRFMKTRGTSKSETRLNCPGREVA